MAATKNRKVVRKAIADNQTSFAELLDARELESGNLVLVFENAEVVMPGGWRLRRDLCIGDIIVAYWKDNCFQLDWKD